VLGRREGLNKFILKRIFRACMFFVSIIITTIVNGQNTDNSNRNISIASKANSAYGNKQFRSLNNTVFSDTTINNKVSKFNIRFAIEQHLNSYSNPTSAHVGFIFQKHAAYIGISHITLTDKYLNFLYDKYKKYDSSYWGINLGYTFYFKEPAVKRVVLFVNFDLLLYQLSGRQHLLNSGKNYTEIKTLVVENCINIGGNYEFLKNVHFYGGAGWGSKRGFFLIIDDLFFNAFAGLSYSF
jgi:hypothetical protein